MEIIESIIERKFHMSDSSLTELVFKGTDTHLGDWAFSKCRNLREVTFKQAYTPGMFGRGVFEGCDRLERITFSGFSEDASRLLANVVSHLKVSHLLTADDVGEKSWFEKWDLALKISLDTNDAEGSIAAALCGEEDISYDGIGSVDGEMPGETGDFVKNAAKEKCMLCLLRLRYDEYLGDEFRKYLCDYLKSRSLGEGDGYAWSALKDLVGDDLTYYRLYLDAVCPDRKSLSLMTDDLDAGHVAVKSFLIREAGGSSGAAFDELML